MSGSNRGIGSLFCNDEDEPLENEFVLEKNGDDNECCIPDDTQDEQTQIETKKSKKEVIKDELLIYSKTVKFTETENNYLQDLKLVLNTDRDTKVIRWCVGEVIKAYGEDIKAMAKKKRKIGML